MTRLLEADLTWTGAGFEPGLRVAVGDRLLEFVVFELVSDDLDLAFWV